MIEIIVFIIVIALFVAYIANIVKLVRSTVMNGLTLARVCGIFVFPLGVILGFVSN